MKIENVLEGLEELLRSSGEMKVCPGGEVSSWTQLPFVQLSLVSHQVVCDVPGFEQAEGTFLCTLWSDKMPKDRALLWQIQKRLQEVREVKGANVRVVSPGELKAGTKSKLPCETLSLLFSFVVSGEIQ